MRVLYNIVVDWYHGFPGRLLIESPLYGAPGLGFVRSEQHGDQTRV
jgi:hypothetical protein